MKHTDRGGTVSGHAHKRNVCFSSCKPSPLYLIPSPPPPPEELENLHKLEVVQLENFLDAQVQAGKASKPIHDGFRRKREQLYSTPF